MHNGSTNAVQEPIFIVGCPRSGTTLLQRMLDAHSEIAIAPETFFVRDFWIRRESYGPLTDTANFDQLIDNLVCRPSFGEMQIDPAAFREAACQGERTFASLFTLLLQQFRTSRGATRVGEKTPNHLLYVDELREFFEKPRFVNIIRDPRAVVNSWRDVPWSSGMLWRDADIWRKYARAAREQHRSGAGDFITVRFEELVRSPASILKSVCRFLTVDFEPAMLRFHEREPRTVNVEREPWKQRSTSAVQSGVADRWRSELSPSSICEIESAAFREMRAWGYPEESKRRKLLPMMTSVRVRKIAWKARLIAEHLRGEE